MKTAGRIAIAAALCSIMPTLLVWTLGWRTVLALLGTVVVSAAFVAAGQTLLDRWYR